MPFRAAAIASAALVTASFLLAPAALASTHKTPKVIQVNGDKLYSALLPASSFGPDYQSGFWLHSTGGLWHLPVKDHVPTMGCGQFEQGTALGFFGETSVALSYSNNPNPFPQYPNVEFYYFQSVYQFASAKAAATYYSQAHAKYAKCTDFTEAVPATSVPGSGGLEIDTQSVGTTNVGKYQAFQVGQTANLSELPGFTIDLSTTVTLEGTDVFTMISVGGTNDVVPVSMMQNLISRVQKLR
jgi:hypothetical protein